VSKNVAVFVDVANLYYSARGQDVDVDYVALLKAATKGRDLIRAYAYSGLDPENENQRKFIDFLGKNGYKVMTKDIRKFGDGRVKANLDIELVVDLFRLADRMDIAVIVSGDGDFAPAIRALQDKGVRCEVISFRPNTSSDLIAVTDEFIDVMKIAGIGRHSKEAKAQRGMSAPEMPAKEVVPEFGFREASPAVAKAALAAIKEPGRETRGAGSGRGRRRTSSAAATEPEEESSAAVAAEDAATTNGDGEPRKRRRRRGGRGRGRGRGRGERDVDEAANGESARDGDIGWVEVDDMSQLAELEGIGDLEEDREYSFEEADAATLAELGLTPDDAAVTKAEEPEQAEKAPARRRSTTTRTSRSKKAVTDAAVTKAEEPEQAEKKPARRRSTTTRTSRSKKASTESADDGGAGARTAEEAPAGADAEAKPKSRSRTTSRSNKDATTGEAEPAKPAARRSRAKKTAADAPVEAGETDQPEEGIWRRFRSARGSKTTS
jgi:uncharacterized LabA/DUF88 family protein